MKKLLLCTLILSLWTIGNAMPKIIKPEENPKYKALTTQINEQVAQIKTLEEKLAQAVIDGSANPPTVKKELKEATNKLYNLINERSEIYKKLKKEYDKIIKDKEN